MKSFKLSIKENLPTSQTFLFPFFLTFQHNLLLIVALCSHFKVFVFTLGHYFEVFKIIISNSKLPTFTFAVIVFLFFYFHFFSFFLVSNRPFSFASFSIFIIVSSRLLLFLYKTSQSEIVFVHNYLYCFIDDCSPNIAFLHYCIQY